ncbi:MAG: hypothetical protein IIC79_04660 [Chloroflexi bacterium]|nr:hypothetical protein [Chloroflexota bacterium]
MGVFAVLFVGAGVWNDEVCAVGVDMDAWSADWDTEAEHPGRNSNASA